MPKPVEGLYAALLVPRDAEGRVDEESFRKTVEFLAERGLRRVVLNGATGEYCLTAPDELRRLLEISREALAGEGEFLCSIGSAGLAPSLALGRMALEAGARALLLPMPYFFPYSQDDLRCYCAAVAEALPAPILLYNLPRFTTGLEPATVERLVEDVPNIAGIKDSSGSLEILRRLTAGGAARACRIVGDDAVLAEALDEGVADGGISGVAGVLPELLRALFPGGPCQAEVRGRAAALMAELIPRLSCLPVPWGLKWMAEWRGIAPARFAQPVSAARRGQAEEFRDWFTAWWPPAQGALAGD